MEQFYKAVKSGDINSVKFLISQGTNFPKFDEDCLRCATFNNDLPMIKYLISLGADKNIGILDIACINGNIDIIKYQLIHMLVQMTQVP